MFQFKARMQEHHEYKNWNHMWYEWVYFESTNVSIFYRETEPKNKYQDSDVKHDTKRATGVNERTSNVPMALEIKFKINITVWTSSMM